MSDVFAPFADNPNASPQPVAKAKLGRPTKYSPLILPDVRRACALGFTDLELARYLDISTVTLYRWQVDHPDFRKAMKLGKEEADDRVERTLYQKAVGWSFESEKVLVVSDGNGQGSHIERVPIIEHVPPSDSAAIFWLKNRRPKQWRDKTDVDINPGDGVRELFEAIAAAATPLGFKGETIEHAELAPEHLRISEADGEAD